MDIRVSPGQVRSKEEEEHLKDKRIFVKYLEKNENRPVQELLAFQYGQSSIEGEGKLWA